MKSEKGVTLASVSIYVIVMLITVAIVSTVSTYFYKNVQKYTVKTDDVGEYTKFNSYFTEEVNTKNNKILECTSNYIVFSTNNQYTFVPENKAVYQNNVKIASGVQNCSFQNIIKNGKNAVTVSLQFTDLNKTLTYIIKN